MTIAPERLDELDFLTPDIEDEIPYNDGGMIHGALVIRTEQPPVPTGAELYQAIVDAVAEIHRQALTYGETYRDHQGRTEYCYCSPGRGDWFRMAASSWPEPIIFQRWDPPLPPMSSKELAVIQPNVF